MCSPTGTLSTHHDLQALRARRVGRRGQVDVRRRGRSRAGDGAVGSLPCARRRRARRRRRRAAAWPGRACAQVDVGEADVGLGVLPARRRACAVVVDDRPSAAASSATRTRGADERGLPLEVRASSSARRVRTARPSRTARASGHAPSVTVVSVMRVPIFIVDEASGSTADQARGSQRYLSARDGRYFA